MTLWKHALAAALALACAPAAFAQSASTLSVKDSTGATQTLAGQLDALSRFHYRDVMEGLTSGGAPDALLTDGAGHALFSLYGTPPVSVSNFPANQTVSGSVGITGTLPAFAAPPTVNLGTLNGAATAAAQTAPESAPGTSATTALTVQGSVSGIGLPVTGPLTAAQLTTAALATSVNQATEITAEQAQATAAGTPADTAYTGGSGTMISLLKAQVAALQAPSAAATASNFAPAQASITTTAAQLVAARAGRRSVTIENTGTTPFYIGGAGVTSGTGFLVPGVAGTSVTINFSGALYATTASGTAAVNLYEIY